MLMDLGDLRGREWSEYIQTVCWWLDLGLDSKAWNEGSVGMGKLSTSFLR